ncbi:hypothetical protein Aperf_G00000044286 [Anoplocephala perfoliata]
MKILPDLVMQIAIKNSNSDEGFSLPVFFTRILINQTPDIESWFAEYLNFAWGSNPSFSSDVNERLLSAISVFSTEPNAVLSDDQLLSAMEYLRTIAALCGHTKFALSSNLRSSILKLAMRNIGTSEKATHYICFCLSFMIGFRSSLFELSAGIADTVAEEKLILWLQHLISHQGIFHSDSTDSFSYSEVILLFGLLFSTSQNAIVRQIIVDTLGIDAPCILANVSSSGKFFTPRVFTNQFIATLAANVPVTVRLSGRMTGSLPIHCVNELLKTCAFNKNRVQIKGWVYRQICECVRPLHGLMLELLETYATNALIQANASGFGSVNTEDGGCALFTEDELLARFAAPAFGPDVHACAPGAEFVTELHGDEEDHLSHMDLTAQLLFLYYMLYIYDQELMNKALISNRLWDAIPITFLLQYARANLESYRGFYPRLLQLVAYYRPHLLVRDMLVQDELLLGSLSAASLQPSRDFHLSRLVVSSSAKPLMPKALLSTLERILTPCTSSEDEQSTVIECIVALNELTRSANSRAGFSRLCYLLPYTEVIACALPRALLECNALAGNRRFATAACSLWRSLHCIIPTRLEVLTVNALTSKKQSTPPLTHRDILKDPVEKIVMIVDRRVYRCPPVLSLLLRIIECSLQASRCYWELRMAGRGFLKPKDVVGQGNIEKQPIPSISLVPIAGETDAQAMMRGRAGAGGNARPSLEPIATEGSALLPVVQQNPSESLASGDLCGRLLNTIIISQEASVVHLFLEFCLPTAEEKLLNSDVTNLREVENIVCSFIQDLMCFDPNLAYTIFLQTYPRPLNSLTARAIPAVKIFIDYGKEILVKSGNIESVIFYVDFLSHFSLHRSNAGICELASQAVDVLNYTFKHALCVDDLTPVLLASGPALCRLSCAFPVLGHHIVSILLYVIATLADAVATSGDSRCYDELVRRISALTPGAISRIIEDAIVEDIEQLDDGMDHVPRLKNLTRLERYVVGCLHAMRWFNRVVQLSTVQGRIYIPPDLAHLPRLYKAQY